jgi:hypothetical protein
MPCGFFTDWAERGSAMLKAQDYSDILTTAVEGGIAYWANDRADDGSLQVERIDRDADLNVERIVFNVPAAEDVAGQDVRWRHGYETATVDTFMVEATIRRLATGEVKVRKDIRAIAARLLAGDRDAVGDADAEVADVIVQVALFGEVVYG